MTTPVGSIRLDLTIDGSDLDGQVMRAAYAAIQPTIAKLNQDLAELQRNYGQTGNAAAKSGAVQSAGAAATAKAVEDIGDKYQLTARAAEKAAAKEAAANKVVAQSLDDVADEHDAVGRAAEKASAKEAAASRFSTRQINATTRALERQAAAWDKVAVAQTAAAGAPQPSAPPPGRGGGGGGGGGGTHFSRGQSGSGGFFGFGGPVVGAAGWNAVAAAVGSFPAAATAVVNLTGAVQQFSQAGLLVPGVVGGIVASVATLKIGLAGVSDAFDTAWAAAASGDAKDIKKATEAMKDIAPSAKSAIEAVVAFRPQWMRLQKDIAQQNVFEGLDETFTTLGNRSMPTLEKGIGGISKAWNATLKQIGASLGSDSSLSLLDRIFGNTADAQTRLNSAIDPIVHAVGTLTAASSNFLPRLADGVTALGTRFDNFITKSVANGDLDRWINEGIEGASHLGETFLNIGKILTSLTKAAGGDGGFLKWLDDATTKLSVFLASDQGQATLVQFFKDGREQLKEWGGILTNVARAIPQIYDASKQWADVLLPFLSTTTDLLTRWPGLVEGAFAGFLAYKTVGGIAALLGSLMSIDTTLGSIGTKAGKLGGLGIGKAGLAAGIGLGAGYLGNTLLQPSDGSDPSALGALGGGALNVGGGALAGYQLGGPLGAAVGAMIGAAVSVFETATRELEQGKKRFQDYAASQATPEERAKIDKANELTNRQKILTPSLNQPALPADLAAKLAAGQLPGYRPGPNGTVIGPDGQPLELPPGFLPSLAPPVQGPQIYTPPPGSQVPLINGMPFPIQKPGLPQINPFNPAVPAPAAAQNGNPLLVGPAAANALGPVKQEVQQVATAIQSLPTGEVKITDASPQVLENLKKVDAQITSTSGNELVIKANTTAAQAQLERLVRDFQSKQITIGVNVVTNSQAGSTYIPKGVGGGRADGGVLPGYSPGVDNMLWPMSGGEGVVIPEAMKALGSEWLYGVNSRFRKGLSRRGYADGGVVPGGDLGLSGGGVIGLLTQIRDLLAGKGAGGGIAVGQLPAADIAGAPLTGLDGVATLGTGTSTGVGPGTPKKLREQQQKIDDLQYQIDHFKPGKKEADAQHRLDKLNRELADAKADQSTMSTAGGAKFDYSSLPFGDPRRILAGAITGAGGSSEDAGAILGGLFKAAAGPIGQVSGDVAATIAGFPLPGPLGYPGAPTADSTDLLKLAHERNPLFAAQAAGFNVPDYTRQGGGASAQNLTLNGGPPSDAQGRIYSDTAALIDRTFTNLDAAEKARHDQTMTVLNEVRDRLAKDFVKPVTTAAVTEGINGIGDATTAAIGTSMGQAAAGPIADAVAAKTSSGSGADLVNTGAGVLSSGINGAVGWGSKGFLDFAGFGGGGGRAGFSPLGNTSSIIGGLFDEGGLWPSGTFGTNLSGLPERVLDPAQTRLFDEGKLGGWNLQPLQQHFATVSGVNADNTVGGDFFGVSEVPIIGAIVNLLIAVLLKVIGVQIEARDTLNEISTDFRDFRGDFKAFDASGRLLNDTSGLLDRTGSSAQAAADERIRVLKLVLEGLIKFIIEKIIVPIGKAVANAVIQAGAGAASGAIGASFPGGSIVGQIASSVITSAGSATVDIIADIGATLAEALVSVGLQAIGELFQSLAPDLSNFIFGGGALASIFDPITAVLTGLLGGFTAIFGGVFGGLGDLLPFDDGGLARGVGLMPKATIAPERVLSPRETAAFERMVEREFGANSTTTKVSVGDVHFHGSKATPEAFGDYLFSLVTG